MVYMDATTVTTRTTTRPATITMTTTTSRSTTTTKTPATTNPMVYWPRTTATAAAPVQTVEDLDPEDNGEKSPSSKVPTVRMDYCSPLLMMDVSWPKTKPGLVSKMPCPPGTIGEVDRADFWWRLTPPVHEH